VRVPGWRWLRSKRVLVALAVVLAAGAGLGSWLATSSSAAPATSTTIVTASYGTVEQTASATGTIEPASEADVDFAVGGQVTAVDVGVGQTVTAGQSLATIDPTALQAELDSAQATLDADESKLSSDTSSAAPSEELIADQAAVTAAQSAVTSAQDSLGDATLTAPIAGEVAEVNLAIGQQVSGTEGGGSNGSGSNGSGSNGSGSNGSSSSDQIVIVNTSSWLVDASVDDSSIGEIQQGDQADIVPEGSETTVYGTVGSIGLIASQSSGVASFPVTVDVTGDPSGLYTGMTADLTIIVKELSDVLVVPTAALRYDNGGIYVELVQNGKDVLHPVAVGTSSGGEAQITSGLAAGDQVVETFVRSNSTGGSRTGNRFQFPGGGGFTGGGGGGLFGGGGGGAVFVPG
jgi:membrane fusion protein, macrolide-specific efflux system